ncbi:MAG: tetratricopeptide repeat protein [Betaproteobacteria bacterium]|nr:tetratricopeptide repeat protein [Betaproteobacteria bacterium]
MKQRFLSLSCVALTAAWLAWPTAFGQEAAAEPATTPKAAAEPSAAVTPEAGEAVVPSIPAELSTESRTRYEAQMKTLRAQVDAAKWQDALTTVEAMNKDRPREPQARFLKTIILTELGRESEAERELMTLVADYPELPEPHNNLATLYAKRGEYDLAQRELEQALNAVPDYAIAHANLADLYLQQAIEHYRRAAALIKTVKDSKALQARAEAIQTMLAPEPKKTATKEGADKDKNGKDEKAKDGKDKDEKDAAQKNNAKKDDTKKDDALSVGCDAPSGFGGKEADDDDVFSNNGTCDIHFDEPEPEKKAGDGVKDNKSGNGDKTPAPAPKP